MGNSAGSARMMNYAKALASPECRVFLCSSKLRLVGSSDIIKEVFPNIYLVGHAGNLPAKDTEKLYKKFLSFFLNLNYLKNLYRLLAMYDGEKIIFLYPSLESSMDYITLIYGKLFRKMKVYCEINELRRTNIYKSSHPDNLFRSGIGKLLFIVRVSKYYLNEQLTRYFDGLICISTSLEKYFKKYNKNILRVPILTNHVDSTTNSPNKFSRGEIFKMCFTGFLSVEKEGFNIFYKALKQLNTCYSAFELHLYGYGSQSDIELLLKGMPERWNFKNKVFYHGYVSQEKINSEFQQYHLLVLPRNSNPQTEYGFSTKLGEYLSSFVPVLITAVSDNKLYLEDGLNSFIVEPDSYIAFSEKILYIIDHYNEVVPQIVCNAVKAVNEHFYYGNYSEKLTRFIQ
jgi:glycosyltransferase involved in cell wall biosynthesis